MAWRLLQGELESVRRPNVFILRVSDGERVRVTIANVGRPVAAEASLARATLRNLLLGKKIEVLANWPFEINTPNRVIGLVQVQGDDVAERLLAGGVVPFVEEKPYHVSQFSECVHRNAEAYAK